jgi:hypothetical protein
MEGVVYNKLLYFLVLPLGGRHPNTCKYPLGVLFAETLWAWSPGSKRFFFFEKYSTNIDAHIHVYTLTSVKAHTHILPLWASLEDWADILDFEIDKVTTGVSLSMESSPSTK